MHELWFGDAGAEVEGCTQRYRDTIVETVM
jgi:hypothetical protein